MLQALRRSLERRIEAADAEPRQGRLDAADDAGCSPTRFSRSRWGRLSSSSAKVGIAAILRWFRSPRSQPRKECLRFLSRRRRQFGRSCVLPSPLHHARARVALRVRPRRVRASLTARLDTWYGCRAHGQNESATAPPKGNIGSGTGAWPRVASSDKTAASAGATTSVVP
jgi:hypothetical protein